MILTHGYVLEEWQQEAVRLWAAGDRAGAFRGTLEIFTGGGKTLIALACAQLAAGHDPELKLVVVVPTQALARQWIEAIGRFTNIPHEEIGLLGAGANDSLATKRALVSVLNSASVKLPRMAAASPPVMLVIDECHRAGAETFQRVLDTPAKYRLGLSATPARDEFDAEGEPLRYDEQAVARGVGSLVFSFGLKEAREIDWLPPYEIHHHGVILSEFERERYETFSREVDDISKRIHGMGEETWRARRFARRADELGKLGRAYVAMTAKRKDLLYRARARSWVAAELVQDAFEESAEPRILLFHERVSEAEALHRDLSRFVPDTVLALEHSKLPEQQRRSSLARFRAGDARVLVSVKSLVEGIDVPEADVGISVASSSSVRQRVQSLGRVLRRSFDRSVPEKRALMHVIYVADTVDEQIYAKEDWSDITGAANNVYWRWSTDATPERHREPGPPREPKPTEEAVWDSLGRALPELPFPWPGLLMGQEYSVDTLGNVMNSAGTSISNSQDVGGMVRLVRGRPGGRFRVTPSLRFVLVTRVEGDSSKCFLGGMLSEPFTSMTSAVDSDVPANLHGPELKPGDSFHGPLNASRGTYRLRQKTGGVIERRDSRGSVEWAVTGGAAEQLAANALRVLSAWRSAMPRGMEFYLNDDWVAWYRLEGQARFLARAPGGFAWPSETSEGTEKN